MSPNRPVNMFLHGEQQVARAKCRRGMGVVGGGVRVAQKWGEGNTGNTDEAGAARGRICQECRELQAYCWVSYRRIVESYGKSYGRCLGGATGGVAASGSQA